MVKKMIGIVAAFLLIVGMAQPVSADPVWHSYDATIRAAGDGLIRGDIVDANNSINAELKFYTSADVLGVAEAAALQGLTGMHKIARTAGLDAPDPYIDFGNYWALPGGNGDLANDLTANSWFVPFVGMDVEPRGGSEGALPGGVTGVSDLAFHPTSTWSYGSPAEEQFENNTVVIAFVAPFDGEYVITNFGARAMEAGADGTGDRTSVAIIDNGGNILEMLTAGGGNPRNTDWVLSNQTHTVQLLAGEDIHFAVHSGIFVDVNSSGDEFYWDGTNVAFDITPEPSTMFLLVMVGGSLVARRRRKRA